LPAWVAEGAAVGQLAPIKGESFTVLKSGVD
jgi:hypothetical protein